MTSAWALSYDICYVVNCNACHKHNEGKRGILSPKTCLIWWWCTNTGSDTQDTWKGCSVIKYISNVISIIEKMEMLTLSRIKKDKSTLNKIVRHIIKIPLKSYLHESACEKVFKRNIFCFFNSLIPFFVACIWKAEHML